MIIILNRGDGINIMRGNIFGNPYVIGRHGDRDQVVDLHRQWLWDVLMTNPLSDVARAFSALVSDYMAGKDIRLSCCCDPLRCHGHNIRDFIIYFAERGGYK